MRIDIDLAISFLCTRVATPAIGDELKLIRVLEYLYGPLTLAQIMGTNGNMFMLTWTDASHAPHQDMRGHTGGTTSLGRGLVIHNSMKQRINTKSSTESEIVGVSDYLSYSIWAGYFLRAQGYEVKRNIFFQDNTSAITLLKNGRNSCNGKLCHIHIRYFFSKDIIDRENMEIQYCSTNKMIADYYTKPLQGKQFYAFRDLIMGKSDNFLSVKECVRVKSKQTRENRSH